MNWKQAQLLAFLVFCSYHSISLFSDLSFNMCLLADSFLQQLKTFDTRRTLRLHAVPDPNADVRHYASRRKSVIVPPSMLIPNIVVGPNMAGVSPGSARHPSVSSRPTHVSIAERRASADRRGSILGPADEPQSRSNNEVALMFGTGAETEEGTYCTYILVICDLAYWILCLYEYSPGCSFAFDSYGCFRGDATYLYLHSG